MPRFARTKIAPFMLAAALVALAAAPVDPVDEGGRALEQSRLDDVGSLVLAFASAISLGIAIRRGRPGDPASKKASPAVGQAQAEAMTRAETEFLANMSHELRTPLNAVIGFADLILCDVHVPQGNCRHLDYVRHIRAGGEQVLAIVDAALDLSQLAAGKLAVQPCRVEPRAIVEACVREVAALAEAANVELVVEPSTAPEVAADLTRLKQALTNLLSNAIKFTARGGRVSIGATGGSGVVAFEVTDTGIGMTPGEIVVALQPFRMVDGSVTRRHGGIGLGLTLAERLVRLHGGELRIDSQPGRGTTVKAILPACTPQKPARGSQP